MTYRSRSEYDKAYREANKEKLAAYQREYREKNRARLAEQKAQWYRDNAERLRAKAKERGRTRDWSGQVRRTYDPVMVAAHSKVQNALRNRTLVRPDACDDCGVIPPSSRIGQSGIHAHHEDYSRPLEVDWLCRDCHGLRHRRVAA